MQRIRQRHDKRGLKGLCTVNGPAGRPSSNPAGFDMCYLDPRFGHASV